MSSTERFAIASAPGGLALVQEVINTCGSRKAGLEDILDSVATAQDWATSVVARYSQLRRVESFGLFLAESDLAPLRQLRSSLLNARSGRSRGVVAISHGSVGLELGASGSVTIGIRGSGAAWLTSMALAEFFIAQHDGTLPRLKICANPKCDVAFYDRSRNSSGSWHDVRVCGNAINLRVSRKRRAEARLPGDSSPSASASGASEHRTTQ